MSQNRVTLSAILDTMEEFKRRVNEENNDANRTERVTMITEVHRRCVDTSNPDIMDAGSVEFELVMWLVKELRTLYGENAEAIRETHVVNEMIQGTPRMREMKKEVFTGTMNRWKKKRNSVQHRINDAHVELRRILNAGGAVVPAVGGAVVPAIGGAVGATVGAEEAPSVVSDVGVEDITKRVDDTKLDKT